MAHKLPGRGDGVAKVPYLQRRGPVVVGCDDELRRNLGVPLHRRAPPAAVGIGEGDHRPLSLQIPHHGGAVEGRAGEDVLHLLVPRQVADLPGRGLPAGATLERGIEARLRGPGEIPNAELAVLGAGCEQVGGEAVELEAAHGPGVLLHLRHQGAAGHPVAGLGADGRADDPRRVVQVHAAVHQATGDEPVGHPLRLQRTPHESVEALVRSHRAAREGHVRGWITVIQPENLHKPGEKRGELSDRRGFVGAWGGE